MKKSQLRTIIKEEIQNVIKEGFLSPSQREELAMEKGYIQVIHGKLGEIVAVYPKIRSQEVTYIDPITNQLEVTGFQSLRKVNQTLKGDNIYILDV